MAQWEFERLMVNPDGTLSFGSYREWNASCFATFLSVLVNAAASLARVSAPIQYEVGAAFGCMDYSKILEAFCVFKPAGFGNCGLYGEDSLITQFQSARRGQDVFRNGLLVFAYASTSDNFSLLVPSGNCRDMIRDVFPVDKTFIIQSHAEGGRAVVIRFTDLLMETYGIGWDLSAVTQDYSQFRKEVGIDSSKLIEESLLTIEAGKSFENNVYSLESANLRRKYHAVIVGSPHGPRGRFYGAPDFTSYCAPRYALDDAVRVARRANRPYFQHVIVVCEDDGSGMPPDVMYEDRQDLLELNFQQECMTGEKHDPTVYLMTYRRSNNHVRFLRLWKTSVKQWLPFAFSPENFGPEFVRRATEIYKIPKNLMWHA